MTSSSSASRRALAIVAAIPLTFVQLIILLYSYAFRSALLWRLASKVGDYRSSLFYSAPGRTLAQPGNPVPLPDSGTQLSPRQAATERRPNFSPFTWLAVVVPTVLLVIGLGVKVFGSHGSPSDTHLVDAAGVQIRVGDCFESSQPLTSAEVRVVPCDSAHQAEVANILSVPRQPFPSDDAAFGALARICTQKDSAVQYPESPEGTIFGNSVFVSPQSLWDAGSRTLICASTLYTTADRGVTFGHSVAVTGTIAAGTTDYGAAPIDGPSDAPSDAGDMPSVMAGSWSGTIEEKDGHSFTDKTASTFKAEITLSGGSRGDVIGTSNYPSLNCSGTLRLDTTDSSSTMNVTETITQDPDNNCQPVVQIEIENTQGGLSYAGYDSNDNYFGGHLDSQ